MPMESLILERMNETKDSTSNSPIDYEITRCGELDYIEMCGSPKRRYRIDE